MSIAPGYGALALCGRGRLGLITSVTPTVRRQDESGRVIRTWKGVHLDKSYRGKSWQSRSPQVLGYADDPDQLIKKLHELD